MSFACRKYDDDETMSSSMIDSSDLVSAWVEVSAG